MITRTMEDRSEAFVSHAKSDVRFFALSDGRRLAYTEFGSATGFPLFYYHNHGGTRLEASVFHREAKKANFRLISFDRPGLGHSDFRKGGGQRGVAQDMIELANALGCTKFGLLCCGEGTSLALAASRWHPDRVSVVLGLSYSPRQHAHVLRALPAFVRVIVLAAFRLYAGIRQKRCACNPLRYLERFRDTLSYTDKRALQDPMVLEMLSKDVKESVRQGSRGFVYDVARAFERWEFAPQDVTVPVHLWQGTADTLVSRNGSETLVRKLQNASLHKVSSRGHFFYFRLMDEVFLTANKQLDRSTPPTAQYKKSSSKKIAHKSPPVALRVG